MISTVSSPAKIPPSHPAPFDKGWVREPLYHLAPLDHEAFPPEHRPDEPGSDAFESYDPASVRRRAPDPPPPMTRGAYLRR